MTLRAATAEFQSRHISKSQQRSERDRVDFLEAHCQVLPMTASSDPSNDGRTRQQATQRIQDWLLEFQTVP